jgi:hypothetical protein
MPGAQKQRTGLPHRDAAGTLSLDQERWMHPAPFGLPEQVFTCWAEAPHRGAQTDVWSMSTGRPEIAAHPEGFASPRVKASTGGLRSSPPGGQRLTPPQVPPGPLSGTTAVDGVPCNGWLRSVLSTHKPCPPSGPEQASLRAAPSTQMGEGAGSIY